MNSKKEYQAKINKLEKELKKLKEKYEAEKKKSKERNRLKQRIRDLKRSRDNWKDSNSQFGSKLGKS